MSQQERAALWRELKDAGVEFPQHYREYSLEFLRKAVAEQRAVQAGPAGAGIAPDEESPKLSIQLAKPDEQAGLRTNSVQPDEPIRTDENGLIWYQDEVKKSAFPRPRARRVLDYTDPGTRQQTIKAGEFTETFEVPGEQKIASQVKITLPTYQVGVYKDPRFPFKIHIYNGRRAFDLFEVQEYFGGPDLVPEAVKRVYVSSTLCYDMRTTIREIQQMARQLGVLGGTL